MDEVLVLVQEQAEALKQLGAKLKEESEYTKLTACLDLLSTVGSTATYAQIGRVLGLFAGSAKLARLLGRKMTSDTAANRPLACALVVSAESGVPGEGFFAMAKKLGHSFEDAETFWEQQRDACFGATK